MSSFVQWIAIASVVLHPILFFRYSKNLYRYYFLILAVMDPLNYLLALVFKSNNLIFDLLVFESLAILIFLPGAEKRNKIIATFLITILFIIFLDQIKVVESLIFFTSLLISIYITVNLARDRKQFNSFSIFLILLCVYQWLDTVWSMFFVYDPNNISLYIIKNCIQIILVLILLFIKDQRLHQKTLQNSSGIS